jgi:RimJ/RimL family protein N-acetyltransferase
VKGSEVTLQPLDEALLVELLRAAVNDADPREVMPPVAGPAGWNAQRRDAFVRFHRVRSLGPEPVESTFAITVDHVVVGAARLCPIGENAVEAGLWIGRFHRGRGVGGAVLRQLVARARSAGFDALLVSTTPGNTAVHRIIAALGATPVREGDKVNGWVDLAPAGRHDSLP